MDIIRMDAGGEGKIDDSQVTGISKATWWTEPPCPRRKERKGYEVRG